VCGCTPIFPQVVAVHPEELDKSFRPLLACTLLLALTLSSVEGLLPFSPIVWYVFLKDVKPADSDDYFNAIRIVRGAGLKLALDTLDDNAAYIGCGFGLCEVSMEVYQEPMTPRFSGLAAVRCGTVSTSLQCWQRSVVALSRLSRIPMGSQLWLSLTTNVGVLSLSPALAEL
jgi:hypothetical protein